MSQDQPGTKGSGIASSCVSPSFGRVFQCCCRGPALRRLSGTGSQEQYAIGPDALYQETLYSRGDCTEARVLSANAVGKIAVDGRRRLLAGHQWCSRRRGSRAGDEGHVWSPLEHSARAVPRDLARDRRVLRRSTGLDRKPTAQAKRPKVHPEIPRNAPRNNLIV